MLRTIRKENPELRSLLVHLRKAAKAHDAPLWAEVARLLDRSRHQVTPVNVGHLQRLTRESETVVVPGKLLAEGRLSKPLTVAAFACSESARSKITSAGGSVLTIPELLKAKPDGMGVRLFG